MANTHTIRLRAAWKPRTQPNAEPNSESDTQLQSSYTRRFNKPTGIEKVTVWLAVDHLPNESQLNGKSLAWDSATCRADITSQLEVSNELLFHVDDASILETVRLEIEEQ